MVFPPAPLPALERSRKVTNTSNDLLPMGRLTHFTPFHRNKGGLAAFHHFLSGGQKGTKAGAVLLKALGHVTAREARAAPALSLVPKGNLLVSFSPPWECQNCDLHGKAAKVGTTQGWWAHRATGKPPGKRGSSDHLPTWLLTIS